MKFSFVLLLFLLAFDISFAQINGKPGEPVRVRICTPSRAELLNMKKPLYVVFSHNKIVFKADSLSGAVSPNAIKSINIPKDSISAVKYGKAAQNGVIEIYLDDEHYPNAYKSLQTDSFKVKQD